MTTDWNAARERMLAPAIPRDQLSQTQAEALRAVQQIGGDDWADLVTAMNLEQGLDRLRARAHPHLTGIRQIRNNITPDPRRLPDLR